MAQPSLRRAIYSWILLLLLAVGVGWIASRRELAGAPPPVSGIAGFLRQVPESVHDVRPAP